MEKYVAEIEGNQFYARDLIDALKNEGIHSAWVWQSGGGTATFVIKENDAHMSFTAGPGSYNWTDAPTSVFTTDELYYGQEYNDYVEKFDSEPEEFPIAPGTPIPEIARAIAAEYRKVNGG
jgi:3'-phosphoadenosine 5'-phosphosulfate sulfotransferase (PAPS reductase)/FAD synthetase